MTLFVNHTTRSAEHVLADLAACRQFRHINQYDRQHVLHVTADRIQKSRESWKLKHPDPDKPCLACGEPRSKFATAKDGLCWRCYVGKVADFWVEDVFAVAVEIHNISCDACDEVFEVQDGYRRQAGLRCLHNMEGAVRPVLCTTCTTDFKRYMSTNWGRAWYRASESDQNKMALAWLAQKIKVLAERVKREVA